jgi:hypothetical protein
LYAARFNVQELVEEQAVPIITQTSTSSSVIFIDEPTDLPTEVPTETSIPTSTPLPPPPQIPVAD